MAINRDSIHLINDPERVIRHHLEANPGGAAETELLRTYIEKATNYESNQRLDPESLEELFLPFSEALDKLVYSDTATSWVGEADDGRREMHYQLQKFAETGEGVVETMAERDVVGEERPAHVSHIEMEQSYQNPDYSGIKVEGEDLLFEDEASRDTAWEDWPWDDQGVSRDIPWQDWNLPDWNPDNR